MIQRLRVVFDASSAAAVGCKVEQIAPRAQSLPGWLRADRFARTLSEPQASAAESQDADAQNG